jgi:hypothetical protein
MKEKIIKLLLALFLLVDVGYSFVQHYYMPLDGDLAEVVMPTPSKGYYDVLNDQIGISVFSKNKVYANPNRYFAHWSTSEYFKNVPFLFQKFTDPLTSVYLSSALIKIVVQLLIIYSLAVYISGTGKLYNIKFLTAAALITPLFQASGYNRYMGIIDQSVTYTFFYALPLALLLLFYLPFFKKLYFNTFKFNLLYKILLVMFIVFLSFNGPLVTGVVLIISTIVITQTWWYNYKKFTEGAFIKRVYNAFINVPGYILFYFILFSLLCLYSLYLGSFNSLNYDSISLFERYSRLPSGFYYQFTQKIGFPLLFLAILSNIYIMKRYYHTAEGEKIIKLVKWTGVFIIGYILLLPMGGYRFYRENIMRYDTIMPVTLMIFFIFGITCFFLIFNLKKRVRNIYIIYLGVLAFIFTNSDRLETEKFECEKQSLHTIEKSIDSIVLINNDCTIMAWGKTGKLSDSELNCNLLQYWGVLKEKKLYYQK